MTELTGVAESTLMRHFIEILLFVICSAIKAFPADERKETGHNGHGCVAFKDLYLFRS